MSGTARKDVCVAAAIIIDDGRVLATQRGYGPYEGWWEFPGGKVEPHEAPDQAVCREILEELDAQVEVERHFMHVSHDYPEFHLEMDCFLCRLVDEEFTLREHHAAKWLDSAHLRNVEWLPADADVILALEKLLG